jgi:hypothetical protein
MHGIKQYQNNRDFWFDHLLDFVLSIFLLLTRTKYYVVVAGISSFCVHHLLLCSVKMLLGTTLPKVCVVKHWCSIEKIQKHKKNIRFFIKFKFRIFDHTVHIYEYFYIYRCVSKVFSRYTQSNTTHNVFYQWLMCCLPVYTCWIYEYFYKNFSFVYCRYHCTDFCLVNGGPKNVFHKYFLS